MKDSRKLAGVALILLGVVLGLYVGLYLMFIGGIVQIVGAFGKDPISGWDIAWGIVRVIFSGAVGEGCALFVAILGAAMCDSSRRSR